MKRTIIIFVIIALLGALSIYEEILVNNTLTQMSKYTNQLSVSVSINSDNIYNENVMSNFDNLDEFWEKQKVKLCMFTNYDKIRFVDESMQKIEDGIKKNNIDLVEENISSLRSFNEFVSYIMGFNINNLF